MTEPRRERRHGKTVAGIQIRTSRERELRPEQAQLDRLWEKFNDQQLADSIPDKAAGSPVYGVYMEYQDGGDDYSVLAGVEVADETRIPDDFATVTLEAGEYLVFQGNGRKPGAAAALWGRIWRYFEQEGAPRRAFLTDYEVLEEPDRITICVGIR